MIKLDQSLHISRNLDHYGMNKLESDLEPLSKNKTKNKTKKRSAKQLRDLYMDAPTSSAVGSLVDEGRTWLSNNIPQKRSCNYLPIP